MEFKNLEKIILQFLLCGALSTGCAHYSLGKNYEGPKPLPQKLKAKYYLSEEYNYKEVADNPQILPEGIIEYKLEKIEEKSEYIIYEGVMPSLTEEYSEVTFEFREQKNGKNPLILVFPILQGSEPVAKFMSKRFVKKGWNTSILHKPRELKEKELFKKLSEDPTYFERYLKGDVSNILQVVDLLTERESVDKRKVGAFGVSMGAIRDSLWAGIKKNIEVENSGLIKEYPIYHFIAMGGGPLSDLFLNSEEKSVKKGWKEIKEKRNLNDKGLYDLLSEVIETDPFKLAPYVDARNVFFVEAMFDKSVPTETQKNLIKEMGNPEHVVLFSVPVIKGDGHYSALLFFPYLIYKSSDFFIEKFKEAEKL